MPNVVSTSALPIDIRPLLGPGVSLRIPESGQMARGDLLDALGDADALITLLTERVDRELLDAAPRLRVVANFAVGYDNIDLPACTERRVVVTNTPDVLTEATADFTWALLLAVARRICEGDALARSGDWQGWEPGQLLGAEVAGRTIGLIGFGRIGRSVARRARGVGMRILYCAPRPAPGAIELGAEHLPFAELLAASDFVSLHCPLTDSTRQLINRQALARMKPTAFLVNTARGGCVDEAALAEALESGEIAGAGLDVFAEEPQIPHSLVTSRRVVLAPHAGSATTTARARMAQLCAEAVRDMLEGRKPVHVVNRELAG